ncbi:MAG: type III-A CRISPR-associated protein Csm2 [Ignavibacteriaceae bacterium]
MAEGKITRVVLEKGFFFIDEDYWCHVNEYNREPEVGHIVEYDKSVRNDGKKNAKNVKFKSKTTNIVDNFIKDLEEGYFNDKGYLKPEYLLEYPQKLAEFFAGQSEQNKVAQVRKFFDQIRLSEGKYKLSKDFDSIVPELYELIPLLESTKNRKHITQEFQDYLTANLKEAVKTAVNFNKGFLPHFQALVAYYIKN